MALEIRQQVEIDGVTFTIEEIEESGDGMEVTLVDSAGVKKKMSASEIENVCTNPKKKKMESNSFVSDGSIKGRIEKFIDGEALIVVHTQSGTGWQAGHQKVLRPLSALTQISSLQAPQGSSRHIRVVSKSKTHAEIIIYSDIGGGMFFGGFSAEDFDNELKALGPDIKNIDVRLNSPGGDVFDGITIYNRLKAHPAYITTFVDGLAASIASVIAMAGDEVVIYASSTVMVHKPWTMTGGSSEDLRSTAERLDMVENQMLDIYAEKTGLEKDHIASLLAAETWMDSAQAMDLGFADSLDDTERAMAASAIERTWLHRPEAFKNKQNARSQSRAERLKALGLI